MQKHIFQLFFLSVCLPAMAQHDQLTRLSSPDIQVFYSAGHEQRATLISQRVSKAMTYYQKLLQFKPEVTLLILSPQDWEKSASQGVIYGMPHYKPDGKTLIVAAEDNPFWNSFLPPLDQLPENLRGPIQSVYTSGKGEISMQAFFDLLSIHELGHAFHTQARLTMQRKWMGELYVNILLHSFIAEKEPESLPALTLFPKMVTGAGAKEYKYTTLSDVQMFYNEIAMNYPKNYGWYQCRWHAAAAGIYDSAGRAVNKKIWDTLKNKDIIADDEDLALYLEKQADKSLGDLIRNWDK